MKKYTKEDLKNAFLAGTRRQMYLTDTDLFPEKQWNNGPPGLQEWLDNYEGGEDE